MFNTICGASWGSLGVILEVFGGHFGTTNAEKWRKKGSNRLFKIALNSLFNDRGVLGFQTSGGVPGEDFDVENPNLTLPDLISRQ